MSFPQSAVRELVQQLADKLIAKKLIMSTAESCTGGWIAQSLTDLAGSSAWFDTGFITYSDEAKQRLLEVPAPFFQPNGPGAVSEETVVAMTQGAISNSRASVAVAVSGVAGPDGGRIGRGTVQSPPFGPSGEFNKNPYRKGISTFANILVVYTVIF